MENNKQNTIEIISNNISYYRKKLKLTQLELAEKLNYSDKTISKWERAEGTPDIFVLKELSLFFGISIDQLISKRKKPFILLKDKHVLAYFFASILVFLGLFLFGILSAMKVNYPAWKLIVYSLPAASLVLLIFYLVWKRISLIYLYLTIFIWSLALSIKLVIDIPNDYWIFIIMTPIYLFSAFMIYVIYRPKKII